MALARTCALCSPLPAARAGVKGSVGRTTVDWAGNDVQDEHGGEDGEGLHHNRGMGLPIAKQVSDTLHPMGQSINARGLEIPSLPPPFRPAPYHPPNPIGPLQLCLRISGCIGLERVQPEHVASSSDDVEAEADSQPWTALYFCFPVHVDLSTVSGTTGPCAKHGLLCGLMRLVHGSATPDVSRGTLGRPSGAESGYHSEPPLCACGRVPA